MTWIKENKFLAILCGSTLAGVILLGVFGFGGSSKYSAEKEKFDAAATEAAGFETLALYPRPENRDQKRKALDEYRKAVDGIQAAFAAYRPEEFKNGTPQEFTNDLLAANDSTRKAFEESGTVVPEPYFVGFESYKTSLASGNITGVLGYQLAGVKKIMLELAKAGPSELKNVFRPPLPEENNQPYTPSPQAVARPFPLEVTFVGTEKSAREFLTSITKGDGQYAVVRTLRITNEKKDPPRSSDAKFDNAASTTEKSDSTDDSGGFVLPGDEAPASAESAAADESAAKPTGSGKILAQVLGDEQVQVFVRLDVLQFLPAKKLP